MKTVFTILITCFYLSVLGQPADSVYSVFRETHFTPDGQVSDTDEKSILAQGVLDIAFYQKHFHRPYHYPELFVNTKYRNETIEIWNDLTKPKDISSNWAYTYTYDSLSRVAFFAYSSCLFCGQQAFNIQIGYDNHNLPVTLSVRHSFDKRLPESEKYEFTYDDKGDIIQLKYFSGGRLEIQIDKL